MAKLNSALFVYLSLGLALATSSNALGSHRRDHADLGRLIKKRAPADILPNQPSVQTPSTSPAAQSTQATSAAAQATSANSASAQTTSEPASASASVSPSTTGSLGSVVSNLLPTESSTTPSSVSSAASASSHSSNTPQTSAQAGNAPTETPTQSGTQSILYLTSGSTPSPTQTSSTSTTTSSGMSHAAMTALIVIAACVGAAVVVWTIIRKWKFRPSSDFEGRMQPIDWQPGGSNEDTGLATQRSLSRASSFHSGPSSGLADDQMRGPMGGYGTTVLNPIPDHDFTAGPAHLAPVGGYADLARGPSPQPVMQESLGHAPSINQPVQYDQYGVPLHHGYTGY